MNTFEPWIKYPPLSRERLSVVANILRDVRRETVTLHQPTAGDNEWSLGCRVYARTCHALRRAADEYDWLTILPEDGKPLRFTFAIGSIPFKFYRGEAEDPPDHYCIVSYAELHQQQLALEIDGFRLGDKLLRLAVETDAERQVSNVILVEMDQAENVSETYSISFDIEPGKIAPIQSPPVDLPPATVEPLKKDDEEQKYKGRDATSQ